MFGCSFSVFAMWLALCVFTLLWWFDAASAASVLSQNTISPLCLKGMNYQSLLDASDQHITKQQYHLSKVCISAAMKLAIADKHKDVSQAHLKLGLVEKLNGNKQGAITTLSHPSLKQNRVALLALGSVYASMFTAPSNDVSPASPAGRCLSYLHEALQDWDEIVTVHPLCLFLNTTQDIENCVPSFLRFTLQSYSHSPLKSASILSLAPSDILTGAFTLSTCYHKLDKWTEAIEFSQLALAAFHWLHPILACDVDSTFAHVLSEAARLFQVPAALNATAPSLPSLSTFDRKVIQQIAELHQQLGTSYVSTNQFIHGQHNLLCSTIYSPLRSDYWYNVGYATGRIMKPGHRCAYCADLSMYAYTRVVQLNPTDRSTWIELYYRCVGHYNRYCITLSKQKVSDFLSQSLQYYNQVQQDPSSWSSITSKQMDITLVQRRLILAYFSAPLALQLMRAVNLHFLKTKIDLELKSKLQQQMERQRQDQLRLGLRSHLLPSNPVRFVTSLISPSAPDQPVVTADSLITVEFGYETDSHSPTPTFHTLSASASVAESSSSAPAPHSQASHTSFPNRLTIGYLHSTYKNTSVMAELMNGLFAHHDPLRYRVILFELGSGCCYNQQLQMAVEKGHITIVNILPQLTLAKDIANTIAQHHVDILVDFNGPTVEPSPLVTLYKPAAVQISYLGWTATTGQSEIDYLVVDPISSPVAWLPQQNSLYSEKLLYLPSLFTITQHVSLYGHLPLFQRELSHADRTAYFAKHYNVRVTNETVLLCSFNSLYKNSVTLFQSWANILKQVPNAYLWLGSNPAGATKYVQQIFRELQIPERKVIWANIVASKRQFLSAISYCDVAMDSDRYAGGTTAVDMVFSTVPLVTIAAEGTDDGDRMVARQSSSIMYAALQSRDLLTTSHPQYENVIVNLALNAYNNSTREEYRRKLFEARSTSILFNVAAWMNSWELALSAVYARHLEGLAPVNLEINHATSVIDASTIEHTFTATVL